jgi:hypothetical protein
VHQCQGTTGPARCILKTVDENHDEKPVVKLRTGNVRIDRFSFLIESSWCSSSLAGGIEIFLTTKFLSRKLSDG